MACAFVPFAQEPVISPQAQEAYSWTKRHPGASMNWARWFRINRTTLIRVALLLCLGIIFVIGAFPPLRERPKADSQTVDPVVLLLSNFGFNDQKHRFGPPVTSKEDAIVVARWICSGPNGEKTGELAEAELTRGVWHVRSRETTGRGLSRLAAMMRADGRGHPLCFRDTPPCPTKPGTSCDLGITSR